MTKIIVCIVIALTGCNMAISTSNEDCCKANYKQLTYSSLPPELVNCKVFRLDNGGSFSQYLYVTHCPNANTITSTTGKNPVSVSLINSIGG